MANKQITINQWEKTKEDTTVKFTLTEEEDSPEVIVRKALPLSEMWEAVDEIVEMCMPTINVGTEDEPKMEQVFMPENRDFAVRRIIMSRYANFKLPQDFSKQYDLMYSTPVYQKVANCIDQMQLMEMVGAAERKLDYRKEEHLSVTKAIKDVLGQFTDAANQLQDVDPDAVQQVLGLLSDTQNAGDKLIEKTMQDATQDQAIPVKKSKRASAAQIVELPTQE